jgi:hypothetical protein
LLRPAFIVSANFVRLLVVKRENQGRPDQAGSSSSTQTERALIEGRDYYLEHGLMVFTAEFLRRRGYCCESGCRHCPYSTEENK